MPLRGIVGYVAAQLEEHVRMRAAATFGAEEEITVPINTLFPINAGRGVSDNIETIQGIVEVLNQAFQANGFRGRGENSPLPYAQAASINGVSGRDFIICTDHVAALADAFPAIIQKARLLAAAVDARDRGEGWHI